MIEPRTTFVDPVRGFCLIYRSDGITRTMVLTEKQFWKWKQWFYIKKRLERS